MQLRTAAFLRLLRPMQLRTAANFRLIQPIRLRIPALLLLILLLYPAWAALLAPVPGLITGPGTPASGLITGPASPAPGQVTPTPAPAVGISFATPASLAGSFFARGATPATAMAAAQTNLPDNPRQRIRDELSRRNISESELRSRLMQRGIDIDNIPPQELPDYEDEIRRTIREIEREREEERERVDPPDPVEPREPDTVRPREPLPERPDPRLIRMQQEIEGLRGIDQIRDRYREVVFGMTTEEVDSIYRSMRERRIYGHDLFLEDNLALFETTDGAYAPDTYVLGEGDVIRVNIFGTSQADLMLELNEEGYIRPEGMPMIFLRGLTVREARNVLRERFSNYYTFQSDQFSVTIQRARTITVNVFGETALRGSFSVSALNTAVNALAAAGGPTDIGSVRDIRLIRGQDRKSLDLYRFMEDPAEQFDFDLRHNDIIYVPVAERIVRLTGAVKRPMRYELRSGETLNDLFHFAGGIQYETSGDFVQIERVEAGERVLHEYPLQEVLSGELSVTIEDGDRVHVRELGRELERYAEITGSVYYPGRYNLDQNPTLSQLLERAQLREQAKTDRVFIERRLTDRSVRVVPVRWDSLQQEGEDVELQRRDRIIVFDQERYRTLASISVAGDVRRPFRRSMAYDERLTIGDALEYAGGLRLTASDIGYIHRRSLFNEHEVEHIPVNLTRDLDRQLQPGDQLNVYNRSHYTDIGEVSIHGMVNEPFRTRYERDLTLTDMLRMAGGFDRGAALNRIDVFRMNLSIERGTSYDVIPVEVDSTFQIVEAPEGFRLHPFDQVVVRRIPQFHIGQNIEVVGEVMYPGVYPLESRRTHLSDLVDEAGGVTGVADPANATILRSFRQMGPISVNLRDAMRNRGDERYDPILFNDDIVNIPRFQNTVTIRAVGTRYGELQQFGLTMMHHQETREGQVHERVRDLYDRPQEPHTRYDREREERRREEMRREDDPSYRDPRTGERLTEQEIRERERATEATRIDPRTGQPVSRTPLPDGTVPPAQIGLLTPLPAPVQPRQELLDMQSINVPFQGRRSARWYIDNYAGGFAEEADKRSVTVTTPSGQVKGTRRRFFFFNNYPDVVPGSTIALRLEPPEEAEEPRIDVERALDRTMQLTTSLLTIMVLIDRLDR